MDEQLQGKTEKLKALLKTYGRVAVAFSAGTDSTLLLKMAKEMLEDEQVLALTVQSDLVPSRDIREAEDFCRQEGIRHKVVRLRPLLYYDVRTNPPDRCYFCKRIIYGRLREIAGSENIVHLLDGTNVDDLQDYRPGHKALKELGVLSPLQEAGFTKADVRRLSREMGLKTAGKASAACLASRVPYGEELTEEKLLRIDAAETFLHEAGFSQVRVRNHGELARLELPAEDMERFVTEGIYGRAVKRLQELGYTYVTLDLQGYRMGSLNEALKGK